MDRKIKKPDIPCLPIDAENAFKNNRTAHSVTTLPPLDIDLWDIPMLSVKLIHTYLLLGEIAHLLFYLFEEYCLNYSTRSENLSFFIDLPISESIYEYRNLRFLKLKFSERVIYFVSAFFFSDRFHLIQRLMFKRAPIGHAIVSFIS